MATVVNTIQTRGRRGDGRRIEMETTLGLFHGRFSSVFRLVSPFTLLFPHGVG